jgi:predicted metal-dependent phosphoesterase TrpH
VIDLHTHTDESDGTYSPAELIGAARDAGLEALAITDHDTLCGYQKATPIAAELGVPLYCGIELSTKLHDRGRRKTVHLLGYFLESPPAPSFTEWLSNLQAARRDRNRRLAARLQSLGVHIILEEVEALGRNMAGRPHFARILVQKGYCATRDEAFEKYLDESAPGYVDREEPSLEDAIRLIRDGGGFSSLAHPVRLGKRNSDEEERLVAAMREAGLTAIEAFHSDHSSSDTQRYLVYAQRYDLKITGGSDFHGENKPQVQLGMGINRNLHISKAVLDDLLR